MLLLTSEVMASSMKILLGDFGVFGSCRRSSLSKGNGGSRFVSFAYAFEGGSFILL